jgi:hypothetical protein
MKGRKQQHETSLVTDHGIHRDAASGDGRGGSIRGRRADDQHRLSPSGISTGFSSRAVRSSEGTMTLRPGDAVF